MNRGRFFVLDGVDGCGKSTQAERLARSLEAGGVKVHHVREPGSTVVGEAVRSLVLSRAGAIESDVEALLFVAARRQLLCEVVEPALARGEHVVCERFHPSTFAYQAVAGDVGEERVLDLLSAWAGRPVPDLILILDLSPELASERRGPASDRMEDKGEAFLAQVVRGYRSYVVRAQSALLVDAAPDADTVAASILAEVQRVL